MIVVTVELWSAISGAKTQLARMHICNDGEGSTQNHRVGDYIGETFVGRDADSLSKGRVSKRAHVRGWRRHDFHVWNLVRRMLDAMGYTKGSQSPLPLIDDTPDAEPLGTPAANADLTVWYGEMPESNGRRNWTASLHRKGGGIHTDGFCFARSEYPDRVRYEADRVRWIIGELAEKPDILAYDADLHTGFVEPSRSVSATAEGQA